MNIENELITNKHFLILDNNQINHLNFDDEIEFLNNNFCGNVITNIDDINIDNDNINCYLTGDIDNIIYKFSENNKIFIIKELSYNYNIDDANINLTNLGQVPININNVGVFFRNYFTNNINFFNYINYEHHFQGLTAYNKDFNSNRKGLYITNVEEDDEENIKFNLLRCSTNLDGPTDNFRETDHMIINNLNTISNDFFTQQIEFNHVLAQIYENKLIKNKEIKATIKQHSDKTKDMNKNALMAFCTFYKEYDNNSFNIPNIKKNGFDYYYKKSSILTKLRFKLKDTVDDTNLVKEFDIVLYPNSIFIMSLKTNRLYTHEIVPSHLPIKYLPTRLGYVVRCSSTKAIYKNNQTYIINDNNELTPLEEITQEQVNNIKSLYFIENTTTDMVYYNNINFSMNDGDYLQPNL